VVCRASSLSLPEPKTNRLVPAFMLRGFWDELVRRGCSSSELERSSGVSRPRRGDFVSVVSEDDVHRLFETAQALSGDETIGLSVGRSLGILSFHLIGHLAMASATLDQAIELVQRVLPQLRSRGIKLAERGDGFLRLGFPSSGDPSRPGARVEADLTAVLLHDAVRHFLLHSRRDTPSVELAYPAPAALEPYQLAFAGGVRFHGEGTFVLLRRGALTRRRSGADSALLQQFLDLALEQYKAADVELDWTARARAALRAQPMPRLVDAGVLANQLGLSVRGLARRLEREGTSYSSVLDESLYERARALLLRPGATAKQAAEALGYAELSSFFRAFRRWSGGLTPSAYRRQCESARAERG
jgi:AraC-like DNA-binding protein